MRLWHGRESPVRPYVWSSFSLGNGGGLHGNGEVSDVCLVWSRALGWLVHISASVFTGRKRSGFYMDESSGLLQLVSTAEKKVCLGSSVYACAKCVCVCLCAQCVFVVSCLFLGCSHRGASRNMFSPLWQHFPVEG